MVYDLLDCEYRQHMRCFMTRATALRDTMRHSMLSVMETSPLTLHLQPLIPFSLKPWHEVGCHICNFYQDIKCALYSHLRVKEVTNSPADIDQTCRMAAQAVLIN